MRGGFGDRRVMATVIVPDRGIATDDDDLACCRRDAKSLKHPEQALDRHVDDILGRLLAGREMNDVSDPGEHSLDEDAIGDRPTHHLDTVASVDDAVMAKRTHACGGEAVVRQKSSQQMGADFARRAGQQKQHEVPRLQIISPILVRQSNTIFRGRREPIRGAPPHRKYRCSS